MSIATLISFDIIYDLFNIVIQLSFPFLYPSFEYCGVLVQILMIVWHLYICYVTSLYFRFRVHLTTIGFESNTRFKSAKPRFTSCIRAYFVADSRIWARAEYLRQCIFKKYLPLKLILNILHSSSTNAKNKTWTCPIRTRYLQNKCVLMQLIVLLVIYYEVKLANLYSHSISEH